jgi:hypothetical protein
VEETNLELLDTEILMVEEAAVLVKQKGRGVPASVVALTIGPAIGAALVRALGAAIRTALVVALVWTLVDSARGRLPPVSAHTKGGLVAVCAERRRFREVSAQWSGDGHSWCAETGG